MHTISLSYCLWQLALNYYSAGFSQILFSNFWGTYFSHFFLVKGKLINLAGKGHRSFNISYDFLLIGRDLHAVKVSKRNLNPINF